MERRRITDIIKEWKEEAGLKHKDIVLTSPYPYLRETLTIYTSKPGYMIGKAGKLFDKYRTIISEQFPKIRDIKIVETDRWYIR